MADVTLHGVSPSAYVRTCRLALEEKGVPYKHTETMPQTPEQLALHPFGKIPALTHGDITIFESPAICGYVDDTFDGPALQPADAVGRARCLQWISAFADNIYRPMITDIVIQRVLVPMRGGETDEEKVAAAAETLDGHLAIVDRALGAAPYFAGDAYSLADMFFLPAIATFSKLPEASLLDSRTNIKRWYDDAAARDASVKIGIGE